MTDQVLFSISTNGVATITLNRPKALNSISYEMIGPITQKLKEWEVDNQIHLVIIKGTGTKGLCAGGDIKTLYEARLDDSSMQKAERFFEDEFQLDMLIYKFSKPIVACLDGFVMGGGVGLTYGASHRIVTERTKWAMPEMNIGFFPDVGSAYFLNQAPGCIGRYLALTASVIKAPDVLYINAADFYLTSENLNAFLNRIKQVDWHTKDIHTALTDLINDYSELPITESELSPSQIEINKHFSFHTVEEIIHSLEKDASPFATQTKATILSKSPFSLKVTLKQFIDGEEKTLEECFATDLVLAKNFLKHEDFFEGIRSVVIDKDQNPQYKYKHLEEVSDEVVNNFFHPQKTNNSK
ncbi:MULTISPECIES: enoyl-CoA hydratase/isomerase family protein [unclassified Bacillus (in: firmicutes)]|uniref:enoyl-CoA hydratase/isomerase family protein n=1 Tax=unclassified Bacillus (in: firmicutes) TaxID=185979 RepID=UPI00232BDD3F|nr:enoyl-CoA hydratase/isomerase family protein [Bacillus sp. BP-3]MDC2866373.1 enoyl-CoA hydratase/isomerase family protein [Bacillus sp. BP-3]